MKKLLIAITVIVEETLQHGLGDEAFDDRCVSCIYQEQYFCPDPEDGAKGNVGFCVMAKEWCVNDMMANYGQCKNDQLSMDFYTKYVIEESREFEEVIFVKSDEYQQILISNTNQLQNMGVNF